MSVRYAVDSDGDVEKSIPQPIFEVISPPELSSWEHGALIEWYPLMGALRGADSPSLRNGGSFGMALNCVRVTFGPRLLGTTRLLETVLSRLPHGITRSSNRADRLARDTEASYAQRGVARASSGRSRRRFGPRDDSSDDDTGEDDYYRKEDAEYNDSSDGLARQVKEVSEMERLNSTPRLELATRRPLAQIEAFSGLRNKSENSMQWLRTFVYEMKGTRTPPNEWRMALDLRLRDGALHSYQELPRKTKRQRKLLSAAFITVSMDGVQHAEELTILPTTVSSVVNCASKCTTPASVKLSRPCSPTSERSPPTEHGLAPIGLPQLASPPVDLDCVYAFVGESKWLKTQRREAANEVKTMEIEKERNGSFGGGEIDERKYDEWNGGSSEGLVSSVAKKNWHDYQPEIIIKLLSGERLG
ncbi:unnamed protein product [Phytophthora fragariaefolia]|uniref:Unnamed protein product n=1 Tax=Phytophthora fragariaefolia TaxID=1490495 RepID=A0A9W6U1T7_9STRA|nr:unnamed protein product [Phytophthora fragariaefolia]